jgi:hypothetical protein
LRSQTGRNFEIKYKEYLILFRNNSDSKPAQHLLENGHSFGRISDVRETVHYSKKGAKTDTTKTCYIIRNQKKEIN